MNEDLTAARKSLGGSLVNINGQRDSNGPKIFGVQHRNANNYSCNSMVALCKSQTNKTSGYESKTNSTIGDENKTYEDKLNLGATIYYN